MAHTIDFSIIQWNVNGIKTRRMEIERLIAQFQPVALLLSETYLKPKDFFKLHGYTSYRVDGPQSVKNSGGLATFIRTDIACKIIQSTPFDRDLLAVEINYNNKVTTLISTYDSNGKCNTHQLNTVLNDIPGPKIFGGDFNAQNEIWGAENTTNHGSNLHDAIEDAGLLILNTGEATYQSPAYRTFSHLDLTYCTADLFPTTSWRVYTYGSSDHFPIIICNSDPIMIWNNHQQYWKLKNANWDKFLQLQEEEFFNDYDDDVNAMANHFTQALIAAGELSIGLGIRKPRQRAGPPWWNRDCRIALAKKQKARHLAKSRNFDDYLLFKKCCAEARRTILAAKRMAWQHYCTALLHTEALTSVWRRAKGLSRSWTCSFPTMTDNTGNKAITDMEKAKALLEPFSHEAPSDRITRSLEAAYTSPEPTAMQEYNIPITEFELDQALRSAKMGAMGPDKIPYQFLKNLAPNFKQRLLKIFNICFSSGTIPNIWKTSTLLPILKPGKPSDLPESYRPIALASCTLKTLEKIIAKRLTHYLEVNNLMSSSQHGFRKGRGCEDALDALTTDIKIAMSKNEYTICAFMDIHKAFDLVRHEAILAALRKANVTGNIYNFCADYLQNRAIQITIGNSTAYQSLHTGVPQGGPLSAHLFATVMDQIPPTTVDHIKTGLYADDTNLRTSHKSIVCAAERINTGLDSLHENAKFWGLQFDPEKSKIIIFAQQRKPRNFSNIQIKFGTTNIPIVDSHRFLGLIFERSLKWTKHVNSIVAKCTPYLNLLRSVAAKSWGCDQASLKTLYVTLIKSKISYGLAQYGACSTTDFYKLEKIQNKALRTILGLPRSTPIAAMQTLAGLPSLKLHYEQTTMIHTVQQIARRDISPLQLLLKNNVSKWPGGIPATSAGLQTLTERNIGHLIHYTEPLPRIPQLQPWKQHSIPVDLNWLEGNKADYNAEALKVKSLSRIDSLPKNAISLYTDGSLIPDTKINGIGITCRHPIKEMRIKLHKGASICTTELYAIGYAIKWALQAKYETINIISDSQSALSAIANCNTNYQVIREIVALPPNIKINYLWIPSHIGISGNEIADRLATQACEDVNLLSSGALPLADSKTYIKYNILLKWNENWAQGVTGRQTYDIYPAPRPISPNAAVSRVLQTSINALATNRVYLNQYLFLIRRKNSPDCTTCHVTETSCHYLLSCSTYNSQRTILKAALLSQNLSLTMKNLLGGAPVTDLALAIIRGALKTYIQTTIGFKRLLG